MMTPKRVKMLAQHGLWLRLLEEVMRSGREMPVSVRLRLTEEGAEVPTALGLALARVSELAWPGDPAVPEVTDQLIDLQREDGSFGTTVGTACALAGLLGACEAAGFGAMPGWSTAWPAARGAGARLAELLEEADIVERTICAWVLASRGKLAAQAGVDLASILDDLECAGVGHDRVLGPMLVRVRGVIGRASAVAA